MVSYRLGREDYQEQDPEHLKPNGIGQGCPWRLGDSMVDRDSVGIRVVSLR